MATEVVHNVNAKLDGKFYTTAAGTIFLAHRRRRDIYQDKWAWCINESTLRRCRELNVVGVGVLWKDKQTRLVHLSHIEDFFGPSSFFVFKGVRQRALPLNCFRVITGNSETVLGKVVRIGR